MLFSGIPTEGIGKPYRLSTKTRFAGKAKGLEQQKAVPKKEEGRLKTAQLREGAATLARKSWADLTDEEDEENGKGNRSERGALYSDPFPAFLNAETASDPRVEFLNRETAVQAISRRGSFGQSSFQSFNQEVSDACRKYLLSRFKVLPLSK